MYLVLVSKDQVFFFQVDIVNFCYIFYLSLNFILDVKLILSVLMLKCAVLFVWFSVLSML